MANKASIAALMAAVASCPKPAPAADGGPIMAVQRGVGFGCPVPKMWEMVNGVATCKLIDPPSPSPAPVPSPPPSSTSWPLNGKTLTINMGNPGGDVIKIVGSAQSYSIQNSPQNGSGLSRGPVTAVTTMGGTTKVTAYGVPNLTASVIVSGGVDGYTPAGRNIISVATDVTLNPDGSITFAYAYGRNAIDGTQTKRAGSLTMTAAALTALPATSTVNGPVVWAW